MLVNCPSQRQWRVSKIIKTVTMRVDCINKLEKNNNPQVNCNNKVVRANKSGNQFKNNDIIYKYVVRWKLMREQIIKLSFLLLSSDI